MHSESNPGAATPYSLYKLYSKQAAATANPYTLRQVDGGLNFSSIVSAQRADEAQQQPLLNSQQTQLQSLLAARLNAPTAGGGSMRRRDDSPPRAAFKVLSVAKGPSGGTQTASGITLSLSSLRS